jgi:hypothetical protein
LKDEFLVDSFVTGKQRLRCVGKRYLLVRKATSRNHPNLIGLDHQLQLDDNLYFKLAQGIYASNEEKILAQPKIQEGICEVVFLRCPYHQFRHGNVDSVLKDGEVSGIIHFADLRSGRYGFPPLLRRFV